MYHLFPVRHLAEGVPFACKLWPDNPTLHRRVVFRQEPFTCIIRQQSDSL